MMAIAKNRTKKKETFDCVSHRIRHTVPQNCHKEELKKCPTTANEFTVERTAHSTTDRLYNKLDAGRRSALPTSIADLLTRATKTALCSRMKKVAAGRYRLAQNLFIRNFCTNSESAFMMQKHVLCILKYMQNPVTFIARFTFSGVCRLFVTA
jgi:hypothetical protein